MKVRELREMTMGQLEARVVKMEKLMRTHYQRSARAGAAGTKAVLLNEMRRRLDA